MNPWYEQSFGKDYLVVYQHRDIAGATEEVKSLMTLLDIRPDADVLDLCCGMGRHSIAMAQLGYQVTGVDLSTVLLEEAKKLAGAEHVKFMQGDMRHVPLEQPFDVVVNLFTSFGYFANDDENERVLHEIFRLLKANGKFIIDFLNPAYTKNHLVPQSTRQVGDMVIHEARRIEGLFVRKHITIEEPQQVSREYEEQVKLYEADQFQHMLTQANLHVDWIMGSYDGQAYDPSQSKRMIFVGHR